MLSTLRGMCPSLSLFQSRLNHIFPPRDLGCFGWLPMPMAWLGYSPLGSRSCCRSKSQTRELINHTCYTSQAKTTYSIATIHSNTHFHGWVEEGLLGMNNSIRHNNCLTFFVQCVYLTWNKNITGSYLFYKGELPILKGRIRRKIDRMQQPHFFFKNS